MSGRHGLQEANGAFSAPIRTLDTGVCLAPPTAPAMSTPQPPDVAPQLDARPSQPRPRPPRLEHRHRYLLRVADLLSLAVSAGLGAVALEVLVPLRAGDLVARQVVVITLAMAISLHLHGLYRRPAAKLRPSGWWRPGRVARCLPTAALLALGAEALLFSGDRATLTAAVAMTVPAVVLVPATRRLVVRLFSTPTVTRILVVGTGKVADRLTARLARCGDTVVVGHVDDAPAPDRRILGGLAELPALCQEHTIDRIVVAFPSAPDRQTLDMLRLLDGQVPLSIIPRMFELNSWRSEVEELHGLPLLHVPPASLGVGAQAAKRMLDLTLSVATVILTLPVWLGIAIAIKLGSPGPVFFRQERSGRGGRPFRIFKFRTMCADAWDQRTSVAGSNEVDGPLFKMARDPRVTRIGQLLRRTSLDEIPQLLNVIRGEMSLVGPRPLPTEESRKLDGAALTRFDVAPGLTGLWQVSGRSDLTYADLQHLDSVYVRSWSLMWDLRIIWATPRSIIGGRGAY